MKLTKAEWAVIAVTALTLVAMFFYFLGSQSASDPVAFSPRESESPSPSVEQPSPSSEAPAEPEGDGESGTEEADPFPIDLNTATVEELMLLPGIGETRARAIVGYREEHGPFQYVEHITGVPGIGEGILAGIMDYVTVSGGTDHGEDPGGG